MFNIRHAVAGGGAILAAGTFVAGMLFGEAATPVEQTGMALSPSAIECKDGWRGDLATDDDNHTASKFCLGEDSENLGWIVYLTEDGKFSQAWDGVSPSFETNPSRVPGWQ